MENLLGKIDAYLAEKEFEVSDDLVFLINTRIKPPLPVKKEDIYIRAMYLVSDQVNSFGGCFPVDEHPKLTELLVDSPVLVGHSKEILPIARNFKADLVQKDGYNWIKVYFYWLKNSPDAESLKENIDHGIYKECSIGFSFEFPECSICKQDMRRCQHIPFRSYQNENGEQEQAHFNYRNINRVHEVSLVYRGAVFGTSMTNELNLFQKHDCTDRVCKFKRIYKESVLDSLSRAGLKDQVELSGKIEGQGYSDEKIELQCDKSLEEKVLNSLPAVFRERVWFINKSAQVKIGFEPEKFVLRIQPDNNSGTGKLVFKTEEKKIQLLILRIDLEKLKRGRRFLCDFIEDCGDDESEEKVLDAGGCKLINRGDGFFNFRLSGKVLKGDYFLRRMKFRDQGRGMLFQMNDR
ncbi:MAG TPA: hypothetical protein VMT04_08575 [Terriglobales bacterium]|nr:hypothetical protein [Terriglobales bacterium]